VQSVFAPVTIFLGMTGHHNSVGATFALTSLAGLVGLLLLGNAVTPTEGAIATTLATSVSFVILSAIACSRTGVRCWVRPPFAFH
jgi:hypothetical protein